MTRFILSNRRRPEGASGGDRSNGRSLSSAMDMLHGDADVLRESASPDGQVPRRVMFEADPARASEIARTFAGEVIVEPEILHFPMPTLRSVMAPIDFAGVAAQGAPLAIAGGDGLLSATLLGGGAPLPGAEALLYVRGSDRLERVLETRSDANGAVRFEYPTFFRPSVLVVVPGGGFWGLSVRGPRDGLVVDCPRRPADGPLAWWHEALGAQRHARTRGRGIRVGVIDTGTGPNACLDHVNDVGSFVDGLFDPGGGADSAAHGSHVAGIIGARPVTGGQYAGIAPGATLYAARVFPPDGGANQMDIADALDRLSEEGDDAPYAAFGGTSMASPLACGALAAILSNSSDYKALPRDATRAAVARRLLVERCTSIGIATVHEGHGMPRV